MKKIAVALGIILLAAPMIFLTLNKEDDVRDQETIAAEIESNLEVVKYVLVGSKGCNACNEFAPVVTKAMEGIETKVHYLDIENDSNSDFLEKLNVKATPTFLKLDEKNQIIDRYEGVLTLDETKKILVEGSLL